jgi:hypothetical protein
MLHVWFPPSDLKLEKRNSFSIGQWLLIALDEQLTVGLDARFTMFASAYLSRNSPSTSKARLAEHILNDPICQHSFVSSLQEPRDNLG